MDGTWAYGEGQKLAFKLEALLHEHGLEIRPGSPLENRILQVLQLGHDKTGLPLSHDVRDSFRNLIGVHDIAAAILRVRDTADFSELIPHLSLLNKGDAVQNQPASRTDVASNKLFELYIACLALDFGTEVELDHPERSTGSNPDILVSYADRRWGIACKTLHGINPEGFVTNLEKGVAQIEASPAEIGFVLFSLKNVLPHNEIWPLALTTEGEQGTGSWGSFDDALQIVVEKAGSLAQELIDYLPDGYLDDHLDGKKSVPGFVTWSQCVTGVQRAGKPVPTNVRVFQFFPLAEPQPEVVDFLRRLNDSAYANSPEPTVPRRE